MELPTFDTFKVETTFVCDICGAAGIGWKRRSYRINRNGVLHYAPVAEPRLNLCAEHFETTHLEDIDIPYCMCDDYLKEWCDR